MNAKIRSGHRFAAIASVVCAALVLNSCGDDRGDDLIATVDPDDEVIAQYERAVEAENGLIPVVVDFDLVDPDASVEVNRTPDPVVDDVLRLVARADDPEQPLIGFDIQPAEAASIRADVELADGRSVEIRSETPPSVNVAGTEGQFVGVGAPTLDLDTLIEVVEAISVVGDELAGVPDGWVRDRQCTPARLARRVQHLGRPRRGRQGFVRRLGRARPW